MEPGVLNRPANLHSDILPQAQVNGLDLKTWRTKEAKDTHDAILPCLERADKATMLAIGWQITMAGEARVIGLKDGHPRLHCLVAWAIAHKNPAWGILGPQALVCRNREAWMRSLAQ
jgi:hypothetical protein